MNPIYQPCPSGSTPSGSTNQREFLACQAIQLPWIWSRLP
ncbi:hypothetical protein MJO28_013686 [Puccinia striiformis f. sp. tritici]|uniref:Uncharacterized protein n=2 Tax=Puccinia striiformis TaxID=27350 RepID=A0A2S4V6M1_9BASI|nr:hypothetical protein MJO28_013686 [Puccinia striiformis f. sp. tritici]POW05105.1 hypothetical protein PSHT_10930 [Puccinia striiformis]